MISERTLAPNSEIISDNASKVLIPLVISVKGFISMTTSIKPKASNMSDIADGLRCDVDVTNRRNS